MNKPKMKKDLLNLSAEEIAQTKKKASSHCINLECQKEQLQILIEKLNNISGERMNFSSNSSEQNILSKYLNNAGSYFASIGNQLKQAQKSKQTIEKEIYEVKGQLEILDNILRKKQV